MKKIIFFILILVSAYVLFDMVPVRAQVTIDEPGWQGLVPCGRNTGTDAERAPCTLCHFVIGFQRLIQYGLYMVTTVALAGIFIAGVMYIISSGQENMITMAKRFLTASLIGFTVVLGGWLIVNVTLWIVSAKGNLGVERAESWWQFKCSTASSASAPAPPAPPGMAGDLFPTDEAARAYLTAKGNDIRINKSKCASESQTNCTDLKGLPQKTADSIIMIKRACGCDITITGGTEAGHKSHGEGKPVVDLRWTEESAKFILSNRGKFRVSRILCPNAKNPTKGCDGYETNTEPHLHMEFFN